MIGAISNMYKMCIPIQSNTKILDIAPVSNVSFVAYFREGWATCPSGHFIRGFHRGGSHQLKSIQWATCCKPALHPHRYRLCYDQNLGDGDTWECSRSGFYVAGIHRGSTENLSSINKLRCCSMYDSEYCSGQRLIQLRKQCFGKRGLLSS